MTYTAEEAHEDGRHESDPFFASICLACQTPTVILKATGFCGTDDESIPCPFEVKPGA